jgi:RNA recognition motif-containing protein
MDIFVGSLPFKMDEKELKALFENLGQVDAVKIIIDKATRQNKGFGFVVMPNEHEALKAIEELNGFEIMGRKIAVSQSVKRDRDNPPPFREGKKRDSGFNRNSPNDRFKKRW